MLAALSRWMLPPLILTLALGAYRVAFEATQPATLFFTKSEPAKIEPRYDWPAAVSNEQLARVLERVKPPTTMPLTNNLVHALRLWGPRAEFASEKIPSGSQMLRYLLDDREFQLWAGKNQPPLWTRDANGVRPRNYEDDFAHNQTASYHLDDLLATLAESGVSLEETVRLRDGSEARVRELLEHAIGTYYPKRFEYEWTMIAYARYAHSMPEWKNKYGEKMNADILVEELTRHKPDIGPCNGLHRLEALVLLYRADEETNNLSVATKRRMLVYMQKVSHLLQSSQSTAGFWTRRWVEGAAGQVDAKASLSDKILVTGHQLEWLALAPEELLPPREQIIRACQWLARTIPELEERELSEHYGPFSHAARALCLWRARAPFDAWKAGTTSP